MDARALADRLEQVSRERTASALVADTEHTLEVSVAPGGRWVVRTWQTEWSAGPAGLRCWRLIPAGGATEVTHDRPEGWVHPGVGLLWPALLPVWGRPDDAYRPTAVLEGVFGPAQVVLAAREGEAPVGTLHVDARRWLCTALELPEVAWTLTEFQGA
ncbi:MAG: hypothetical protein Q4F65_06525 [Propionibacteriaceae bacterium]|nr:hypothetical protein [Propionibacteriaceae bacterium]